MAKPKPKPKPAARVPADQALLAVFRQYGLESLAKVLLGYAKSGIGGDEAYLKLRDTKEYKQRFVGNDTRQKKGLPLLSEAEYLSKERDLRLVMSEEYGLPKGFYDQPDDFAKAIGADLGGAEMRKRLEARKAIVTDGKNTGVLAYAKDKYGLSDGDLIAFFTDPDRAAPLLTKIAAAAGVGAAAQRAKWGDISKAEAERLAALGVSADQAQSGFGSIAELTELTADIDGQGLSRQELVDAAFNNDAQASAKVTRKQAERKARFQSAGGFAETEGGIGGLGRANT